MEPDLQTPPRFKAELRELLLSHPAAQRPTGTVTAKPPWVRRRIVPALALGVAALAVVLVIAVGGGGGLAPAPASAAAVLNASAAALEKSGSSLSLARGQYFYLREAVWFRYAFPGTRPFIVRSLYEDWIARNGSGSERVRVVSVIGRASAPYGSLTHSYSVRTRARARPFSLQTADPAIALSYSQLRALPADAQSLSRKVERLAVRQLPTVDGRGPRGLYRRQLIAIFRFDDLRGVAESPTPPEVRAAVYRALALTPGIRLLGRRDDAAGRSGMAVATNLGAVALVLIIDPSTGQLLQTSRTLLRRSPYLQGWPQGLVNRATILASGVVRSAHATIR
jgi:hypothetical protein